MHKDDIPDRFEFKQEFYAESAEWINKGESAIVHPSGNILAGPVSMKEEILYAEVDLRKMEGLKRVLDVAGHYARPDVFELIVNNAPRALVERTGGTPQDRPQNVVGVRRKRV